MSKNFVQRVPENCSCYQQTLPIRPGGCSFLLIYTVRKQQNMKGARVICIYNRFRRKEGILQSNSHKAIIKEEYNTCGLTTYVDKFCPFFQTRRATLTCEPLCRSLQDKFTLNIAQCSHRLFQKALNRFILFS